MYILKMVLISKPATGLSQVSLISGKGYPIYIPNHTPGERNSPVKSGTCNRRRNGHYSFSKFFIVSSKWADRSSSPVSGKVIYGEVTKAKQI